jgi:hypothetical protein
MVATVVIVSAPTPEPDPAPRRAVRVLLSLGLWVVSAAMAADPSRAVPWSCSSPAVLAFAITISAGGFLGGTLPQVAHWMQDAIDCSYALVIFSSTEKLN